MGVGTDQPSQSGRPTKPIGVYLHVCVCVSMYFLLWCDTLPPLFVEFCFIRISIQTNLRSITVSDVTCLQRESGAVLEAPKNIHLCLEMHS